MEFLAKIWHASSFFMESISLAKILKFIRFTHRLQKVERMIPMREGKTLENDMEHQYQLAMLAWYVASTNKMNLDLGKVIQYALIHDLVEAYAGDVPFFGPKRDENKKKEREARALTIIKKEFPEFKELGLLLDSYHQHQDLESQFVYELDKILPIYNIYLDNGRLWKKENISLSLLIEKKNEKITASPIAKKLFLDIASRLKKKEKILFPEKNGL